MANLLSDADVFGSAPSGLLSDADVFGKGAKTEPGGFVASAKQTLGAGIKGAGQAAADFIPGVSQENALKRYGQEIIEANPTAVHSFSDLADKPWTAVKEATGNALSSMGGVVGARALGTGITAAAPLAGPAAPIVAGAGQAISWLGPVAAAALPSFGGIREQQIHDDPNATNSAAAKAAAAVGAGTVGAIESRFGPEAWGSKMLTEAGRNEVAKLFAAKTLPQAVAKGAVRGAAVEGAEELAQNPVEQLAAFQNPLTAEALKDTAFSGAMGALGGGVLGGGTGAASRYLPKKPDVAPGNQPAEPPKAPSAPIYTGTPGDQTLQATVDRQNAVDAAQAATDALYNERDAFERERAANMGGPTEPPSTPGGGIDFTPPQLPDTGPLSRAANISLVSSSSMERRALFPFASFDAAEMARRGRADLVSRPHPTVPGRFALVPSGMEAPRGTGSFADQSELANFIADERKDQSARRAAIAEGNNNAIAQADQAVSDARQFATRNERLSILDGVLSSLAPGQNPNRRFDAALKAAGFRDTSFTEEERTVIGRYGNAASAFAEAPTTPVEPSSPNEMGDIIPAASGKGNPGIAGAKIDRVRSAIAAGFTQRKGFSLINPATGEKFALKTPGMIRAAKEALEKLSATNTENRSDENTSMATGGGEEQRPEQIGSQGNLPTVAVGVGPGDYPVAETSVPSGEPAVSVGDGSERNAALSEQKSTAKPRRTRMTPLDDPRISKHAESLQAMAGDVGWAETGGLLLRDANGNANGRTQWIPHAEWFRAGMIGSPEDAMKAVQKAVSGEPMSAKEKRTIQGMMDWLDHVDAHPNEAEALADMGYDELTEPEQEARDALGDFDPFNPPVGDVAAGMRALGFTEEEIRAEIEGSQSRDSGQGDGVDNGIAGRGPQESLPGRDETRPSASEGQGPDERPSLELERQTDQGLADKAAREQEPQEPTKEQADRERDAAPFSLSEQSQPKPQGVQSGLFTADGRVSVEAKQPEKPAEVTKPKNEQQEAAGLPAATDGGSRPVPAVSALEETFRPLIERLIRNKRVAKELGFDIDGAIAKAKAAMGGKKQMPGSFRALAKRAEKLGDTETASILRQIADLNDARKSPKKADPVADQNPIKSEAPAVTESVAEKAQGDQQAAEKKQAATNPDEKEGADLSWAEVLDEAWNNGFETGNADFVPQKQHLEQAYQRTFTDAQVEEYTATYQRGARESDEKASPPEGSKEGVAESGFDSESWDKEREARIKASKQSGAIHLDDVPASVESMRGKEIFYVHNPKQRGVIRTVDNRGNVYVYWSDKYSADKEMASEVVEGNKTWLRSSKNLPYIRTERSGKTYVFQSSLGTSDLKDYVFADAKENIDTAANEAASSPTNNLTEPTQAQKDIAKLKPNVELKKGDRFKDGQGKTWEVWTARTSLVEAFPVIEGKIKVSRDDGVRFATDERARLANPEARTDVFQIPNENAPDGWRVVGGHGNEWVRSVDDQDGIAIHQMNVRRAGDPAVFTLRRSTRFKNGITGAPSEEVGKFDSLDAAVTAADHLLASKGGLAETKAEAEQSANNQATAEPIGDKNAPAIFDIETTKGKIEVYASTTDEAERVAEKNGFTLIASGRKSSESVPESLLDQHTATMAKLADGTLTLDQYRAAFATIVENKDAVFAELSKLTKDAIFKRFRALFYRYKNDPKPEIIKAAYRSMMGDFVLSDSIQWSMGQKYEDVIRGYVDAATPESLAAYAEKLQAANAEREQRREEIAKAIADPQTLEDYRRLLQAKVDGGKTVDQARMELTPEQRVAFDTLWAEDTRGRRSSAADAHKTDVQVAARTTSGDIIETKHTKTGEDLFVVKAAERVERDVYNEWNASAKRLGGRYSSFRGNGAVPGFQFKSRENAAAFLQYLGGDVTAAKEAIQERRDAFADDRSQSAVERLNEMADRLEERADESLAVERKANTARRARFAASAEAAANGDKAMARTMRNIADAIADGTAKFLDRVRQKVQVEMLRSTVASAKYDELRQKYPSYVDQEKHRGEKPTAETADYARWPRFTADRADLARLGRDLLQIDGAKQLGNSILKVADDVTEAYKKFAKENLYKVSVFSVKREGSDEKQMAVFPTAERAEAVIARSGFKGKATTISFKRGEHLVIMGPEMAREAGLWHGDPDKRITLTPEAGEEIVAKVKALGKGKVAMPYVFENVANERARWKAIGIETAAEQRAALREFIALQEAPAAPDRIKQMEREMIGRKNDGLDFFPTPAATAQAMIEAADIKEGMSVLEPSAGMGHIAEQIRDVAGVEPDVIEFSGDRRELLEAKGFNVVGSDFMDMNSRGFTYGDVFRTPDGTLGVMRGSGGLGSNRVGLDPLDANGQPDPRRAIWTDRDELVGVEKRASNSGYDRIIMNPPFSNRRDAEHVQHAYSLLKPGGRLVAIMGEGVFYGQDKKAQAFRDWMESVGGTSEKLEEGTFLDPSLPVNTGVNARMVVIDKSGNGAPQALESRAPSFDSSDAPQTTLIRRVVDSFLAHFQGAAALDVRVVASRNEIPPRYRPSPYAEGVYHDADGVVYLISSNLPTQARAWQVLMHEAIGHYGLSNLMGEKFAALQSTVLQKATSGRELTRHPQPGEADYATVEAVRRLYPEASDSEVAQEVLARMAEMMDPPGWSKILFAQVRHWLRTAARAMNLTVEPSLQEAKDAVVLAAKHLRDGKNLEREMAGDGQAFASEGAPSGGFKAVEDWAASLFAEQGGANPNILESRSAGPVQWKAPEPSRLDDLIYSMQDKHVDMKRVVQSIKQTAGTIADNIDPYLQEELFHGRAAKAVKDFLDLELRPLIAEMRMRGVGMADFEEYLWNRHAEERNAQIAKINPQMPDGGSGLATADARAYLAGLSSDKRKAYESLAAKIDAITARNRQVLVDSGLEKAETVAAWEGAYKHYVPLQREDVETGGNGTGQGFSVRGTSSKRAVGSGRPVADIIANLAMQRERFIVKAEKNRVSIAIAGLAASNPNPDFWKLNEAPKERVVNNVALYNVLDANGNKVADFTRMDEAERMARSMGGEVEQTWGDRVQERIVPGFKNQENVVHFRLNGEDHFVVFNEREPRALRMAQSIKNLDMDQLGRVLTVAGKATRYFASINTQYNPIFGVINLFRDVQGALLNLSTTPLAGEQKRVAGYTVDALRGIYADIRAHRAGKVPSSRWASLYEEFQNEGGQTGYRDQFSNAEQRAEAIAKEIKAMDRNVAFKATGAVFDWLSDYNQAMENAVRLAAYAAAKERGLSKQQAASLAKNLTVNFNRKGQVATQMGALYAFFNASMQGTARLAQTLTGPMGRRIITGGILLGSMQAMLLASAGMGDDEPPEFVRERNLILPIGDGKYISLPMPLGFHVLPNLGRIPTEFVMSGFREPARRISDLVAIFADTFNPIGNAGLSLQTIAPTVVDPFAALAENKDWTGKPIAKMDMNANSPTPGHSRAKDTSTVWSKSIAEAINYLSGGTKYKPGVVSPTPDQIDYLIGQVTGGVGREAAKAEQTVTSTIFTGEELPLHKVPLVGRFVGDTKGQSAEGSKFYAALQRINEHENEIKGMRKDGRGAEIAGYIQDNPEARLMLYSNHVEREVQKLRAAKRDALERGDEGRVRMIESALTAKMRAFNERVRSAQGSAN